MKPSQVSGYLRKIAAAIDSSKNPRRDLVAADLGQIIAAIDPSDVPPWAEDKPTKEQRRRIKEDLGEEPYEARRDIEMERGPREPFDYEEEYLKPMLEKQWRERWEQEGKDPETIEKLWDELQQAL